jgi:indolepyruvate ferredoxin oxidoreductase beta subunit
MMTMEITNILFAGVGGQGILTSSRILALAALHAGLDVKMSEVHGMAQRGGNVDTHVRVGKEVPSCLIPRGGAHFLVAFEKLEALRYMDYLRPDGTAFVCPLEIPPLTQGLKKDAGYVKDIDAVLAAKAPNLVWVDAVRLAREVGDPRMVNVIMLGALAGKLPMAPEDWEAAVRERFPAQIQDACLRGFRLGVDHVSAAH